MANIRRPAIAFALSILGATGLGHLYIGQVRAFVFAQVVAAVFAVSFPYTVTSFIGFAIVVITAALLSLSVATHAAYKAAQDKGTERQWFQRWYVYIAIYLILTVGYEFLKHTEQHRRFETVKTSSTSMEPSIVMGDNFVIDKSYFAQHDPRRGDPVILTVPDTPSGELRVIKRIIGLPGERIRVAGPAVYIDGVKLEEPYVQWIKGGTISFPESQIPPGTVFVMGDNRDQSKDSRRYDEPFVPIDRLVGRPLYIVYNIGRLDRIGLEIK